MTPLDCMSIGYFMASLLRAGGKVSVLYLSNCSIDDYSLDVLVEEFSRHAEVCPTGVMQAGVTKLDIGKNSKITENGIACVLRKNFTSKLTADYCGISNLEMESLARALAVNSTLEELDISNNNLGDKGIGHIGTALLTNTTLKILNISNCVRDAVGSSQECLDIGSNHMYGRAQFFAALQKNTTLRTLNFSCCGMSDLVPKSLARALEVNCTLEELDIVDDNISDDGIVYIAKSLEKNNTLKVLYVGPKQDNLFMPVTGFTSTGVLSLARGVATNTSIECLSIRWLSTDLDSTLKMIGESVKKSGLKTLALLWLQLPGGSLPALEGTMSMEKASEWFHNLEVGGNELILSLEDSHVEILKFGVPEPSDYGCTLEFQTTVDLVNSARRKKGLPDINFSLLIILFPSVINFITLFNNLCSV